MLDRMWLISSSPHCNHADGRDFYRTIEADVDRNNIPSFVWSDAHDEVNSYAWQCACLAVRDIMWETESEIEDRIPEVEAKLEDATGQSQSALRARLNCFRWLLEGEEADFA